MIRFEPSEFSTEFTDPCNPGEVVTITGTTSGFFTELVTPTGDYMYTFHTKQMGTGVGSEGSEYKFNYSGITKFISEDPASEATVFTDTFTLVLINLGSGPDIVVHAVSHVTGLPDDAVGDVSSPSLRRSATARSGGCSEKGLEARLLGGPLHLLALIQRIAEKGFLRSPNAL
jgi:hypothetical protein